MADIQTVVEVLRRLAIQVEVHNLADVADSLEKLGSLENLKNSLDNQISKLTETKTLLDAELAEAKSGVLLIRDQGENLVREAEDHAQHILDSAKDEAEKLLAEAKDKAEAFAQSALDNANH